ncbi:MAG: hypothetical protein LBC74_05025 [Planctomycetaceae bacterium]|jgi:hypothetical protein|nr:hypothetical protein [Planctomycetaceae bacterium]
MFSFTSRKFSRLAVFLHDGGQWYVYIFVYRKTKGGRWEVVERFDFPGKNSRQIPSAVFEFAERHNARRVRIVLSQNVQKLENVELPSDATSEELQTVVALAYSQATGTEYGTVRVVSSYADARAIGGISETLFAAGIETSQLEQYDKNCNNSGLQFDGCGILEMTAVTVGTKYFDDSRFLILRRDRGFYVTCASDDLPMTTSGIALSSSIEDKTRDAERTQAIARRLNNQKMFPLQVWYTPDVDSQKLDEIRNSLDPATQVTFTELTHYLEDIAREIVTTTTINEPTNNGAIVGLPEKEKDPYRAGTWLFAASVVIAILLILINYQKLRIDLNAIKLKTDAWEKLKSERKKLNDKLTSLDSDRKRNEKIIQILNQKNPLPTPLTTLLEELKQNMPLYTRLTSIEQLENEELVITGYTFYQEGFFELRPLLNQKLTKHKMIVELKLMEKISDSNGYKFILRVYKSS